MIKRRKDLRSIRHKRVRKKVKGDKERPRLCVFRSQKHIYAQVIDDEKAHTLVSSSTLDKEFREKRVKSTTKEAAFLVGKILAERLKKINISKVSFDRGGYKYHGRVKALAEGVREGGIEF